MRGEAPFGSHLLYAQHGILNDAIPGERIQGMDAGFAWGKRADLTAVYIDRGLSRGMSAGIIRAANEKRQIEYRTLRGFSVQDKGW